LPNPFGSDSKAYNRKGQLQRMLTERDALIAQLKARLEKLEFESRNWLQENCDGVVINSDK